MKKAFPRVFLLILIAAILSALALTSSAVSYPPEEMRGVWIASVYNIDFPSKTNLTATEMKNEIDEIMKNAKGMNLNAVFFQVRPSADALYKSNIFPWSAVLTGTQGKTPSDSFDPLSYAVESAHKNGLELHAWINPFKITRGSVKSPNTDLSKLAASHPARKNPDLVVSSGGELYFDPGEPKARQLIIDGVREIVENYDVDGIHFDDYFYPGRDFDDAASYKKYGSSYKNIGDYRRANVDSFISTCYQTIKRLDPSVKFGVSPFAVWANKKNVSEGSDTSGGVETYLDHYADTKKWVKEGYIDYIAPQVYWNIGFKAADYETLVKWWSNVCKNTNVKLYVGHAAYKIGDSSQSTSWLDPFEIPNQVKLNRQTGVVSGSIFYGYEQLKANSLGVTDFITALFSSDETAYETLIANTQKTPEYPKTLNIARPSNNLKTTYGKISIQGSSNPAADLTMNGEKVERTSNGFFNVYVALKDGKNTFEFVNGSEKKTLTVTKGASTTSKAAYTMTTPEFKPGSFSPSSSITRMRGETVKFSCIAPANAKVSVKLGYYKLDLKQITAASGDKLTAASYEGTFTMPSSTYSGTVKLGNPIFVFEYNGKTVTSEQKNTISLISGTSDKYATVQKTDATVRTGPSSSYNRLHPLAKGTQAGITGESGNYYRISSGGWIAKDDVKVTKKTLKANTVQSFKTTPEKDGYTEIRLKMPINAPYDVKQSDGKLTLTIYNTKGIAAPSLKDNDAVSSVSLKSNASNPHAVYEFKLKNTKNFLGYFVEFRDGGLVLGVRLAPTPKAQGEKPLTGTHILLDPGHGGKDPGALGPASTLSQTEDDISLILALQAKEYLVSKGAKVTITRTKDTNVALESRADLIRTEKPDLAISIHENSMADNVDLTTIDGLMVLYTEQQSKNAATFFHDYLTSALSRTKKNARYQSLAVCRVTQTPAILIETGFMSNIYEYEWLTNSANQQKMGNAIGQAAEQWLIKNKG